MKADLVLTHIPITDEKLKNRLVVIIDILRTSTTICVALRNGAKEVIPVANVADAMTLAGNLSRDNLILCGEREGKLIEGFNLGNSPLEYAPEMVTGKSLIFTSTNGSVALVKARNAKTAIIAGFVNMSACVDFIMDAGEDVLIICAGNNQQFSMEDTVCGGMLIHFLMQENETELVMNDGAEAAHVLFEHHRNNYLEMLQNSTHGKYLQSLDFKRDLEVCAEIDSMNIIPKLLQGKVIAADSE